MTTAPWETVGTGLEGYSLATRRGRYLLRVVNQHDLIGPDVAPWAWWIESNGFMHGTGETYDCNAAKLAALMAADRLNRWHARRPV